MKTWLALLLLLVTFTACKKTKTEPPIMANNKIVGKWQLQSVTVIPRDSTGIIMNAGNTYPEPSYFYFNFRTDGTWVELLSPETPADLGETGNYILHADTSFGLTYAGAPALPPVECKIVSLSDTSFVFTNQRATLYNGVTRGYLEYVFKLSK
ncbi:MAG: hypothetical protein ACXVI9_10215 [Mucilaginibacter sp.]